MIDGIIIGSYFLIILIIGLRSRRKTEGVSVNEYFLSSRSLRWPTIAMSTIGTNVHAGHFLGMMGSAYLYGLAQANFEINAIVGILVAAFVFVPVYLKHRVMTISQFFEETFGPRVALTYSLLSIALFATVYVGAALFWGAYAVNAVFGDHLHVISDRAVIRVAVLLVLLGAFSATYTLLGGLTAVVRTDVVQCLLLMLGGVILLYLSVTEVGGWGQLYEKTPHLMHLHLSADHPTLPWTAIFGMLLLNLNYWGCNQVILQRALAAENLREAQIGLLVGGVLKYVMAAIIILPGVALAGMVLDHPLQDPDRSYIVLIDRLLPTGLRGLILVGLFASLMSSVDSMFHSLSTLRSIDVYRRCLNPAADDRQVVRVGQWAIVVCLMTGILFGFVQLYVKYQDPGFALTHWFNDVSYYIKNGFVVLISAAVLLVKPSPRLVFSALLLSIVLSLGLKVALPDLAYFNRALLTIVLTFAVVAIPTMVTNGWRINVRDLVRIASPNVGYGALALGISLIVVHVLFH